MARKKKEECKAPPAWLTSFGDLMSLLLTFFILLYSMSTISLEKFYQAIKGIIQAFGGHYVIHEERVIQGKRIPLDFPDMYPKMKTRRAIEQKLQEIHQMLKKMGVKSEIAKYGTSIRLRINTDKLFPPGSEKPYKETIPLIMEMCKKLKELELPITIEGHTDNVPIRSKIFPSNWELSAARAVSVLRLFIQCGYDPRKLSAAGCGPYRPIAPNTTPEGRAKNRRIEIVIHLPG
ncbi:OmpA/MotB domain protein [Desulfurobacterium thermolithotrophum DSM 11699]|uniref:OmpA/MotB domain protein n=1 Tax=Desulfurobacterium thermolithotrophum (strain DSM 11699 / BSA) TaxID=868864 RepID=F0S2X6_DESTD|nr:flagellar motor protein MotB [Desulfurobacterium thermolithotrophum]ADY73198.1 OmpA/MotB domain protein [Desulfurobacterium thermolithotrophum DSM 11699]